MRYMLTKVNSRFKTIVQSVAGPLPEIHISSHLMGTVPRYILRPQASEKGRRR